MLLRIFEWMLLLLVAAVGLAALARRWGAPYPSLLALLGAALVFLPGVPRFVLEPDFALALFVAPVLLDAAFDSSPRDLRRHWLPIAGLAIAAVGTTVCTVALTVHALVPGLPWAAAIALGAIVAPPDAAAANAVLRQARPPHRIMQILEGESLLNDASALLVYRLAVTAAQPDGAFSATHALPLLLLAVVGSVVAGYVLAQLALALLRRVDDTPTSIVLQFATTFGVWLLAERLGLSGILTVVVYGIAIARVAPTINPARIRVPALAVWETTVFVLNAFAFVLIGLQLGPIVERLAPEERGTYGGVALAVLGVCILTRILWVGGYNGTMYWKHLRLQARGAGPGKTPGQGRLKLRSAAIVGWCGMRGIVTLATALALPDGAQPFPGRDLILVTAFTVVLGTLVLQGLTLRPLLRWADLHDDGPVDGEVRVARRAALAAMLRSLEGDESKAARVLRYEYEHLWGDGAANGVRLPALRVQAVAAARAVVAGLRSDGTIGDEAYRRLELELDRAELFAEAS